MESISKSRKAINLITRVAIFGSLSIILYMVPGLQFGVPFAPAFLKIHLDEIPVLLAGFAYGTPTAVLIIVFKSLFKLIQDIPATMGVGVLSDFIYGLALCVPACLIYNHNRKFTSVLLGVLVGIVCNLLFSCIFGLYVIFPLYGQIYGESMVLGMFQVFDKSIGSLNDIKISYEFLLPFNLLKDGIVVAVVFVVYKPMRIIVERVKH